MNKKYSASSSTKNQVVLTRRSKDGTRMSPTAKTEPGRRNSQRQAGDPPTGGRLRHSGSSVRPHRTREIGDSNDDETYIMISHSRTCWHTVLVNLRILLLWPCSDARHRPLHFSYVSITGLSPCYLIAFPPCLSFVGGQANEMNTIPISDWRDAERGTRIAVPALIFCIDSSIDEHRCSIHVNRYIDQFLSETNHAWSIFIFKKTLAYVDRFAQLI